MARSLAARDSRRVLALVCAAIWNRFDWDCRASVCRVRVRIDVTMDSCKAATRPWANLEDGAVPLVGLSNVTRTDSVSVAESSSNLI